VTRGLVSSGEGWWSSWCRKESAVAPHAIAYPGYKARREDCNSILVNEMLVITLKLIWTKLKFLFPR
jgi:hypothetical protein